MLLAPSKTKIADMGSTGVRRKGWSDLAPRVILTRQRIMKVRVKDIIIGLCWPDPYSRTGPSRLWKTDGRKLFVPLVSMRGGSLGCEVICQVDVVCYTYQFFVLCVAP